MENKKYNPRAPLSAFIAGWLITIIMGIFLIISGIFIFIGTEQINMQFEAFRLSHMQKIIGIGKIISALLYLYPGTFLIGALLLTAFLGGAIVANLSIGNPITIQSILLILTIASIALRVPDAFES